MKECDLAKFFFIVGHTALMQLVYIEDIHNELRRRRNEKFKAAELREKEKNDDGEEAIEKELGTNALAAEQDRAEKEEADAKRQVRIIMIILL